MSKNPIISATLQIYLQHAKKHRWKLAVVIIGMMGGSAMGVIVPLYFKKFFDVLTAATDPMTAVPALLSVLATIAGLELVRFILWRIGFYVNIGFQTNVLADLSNHCFAYLHRHSFSYFNSNFVGSLVKRVNWFTRAFESIADKMVFNFLPLLTDLAIVFVVLLTRNRLLGLGALAWIAVFLTTNWFLTSYKIKFDLERNAAETKATGVLADTITNHANVKLFGGYGRERQRFGSAIELVKKLRTFTWKLDNLFDGLQVLLSIALEIGIFYIAIGLWREGQLTIGDFVLIQSYLLIIFEKVWDFGKIVRHAYTDLTDAAEMTVILTTPHEIQDAPHARPLKVRGASIEFRKVDFYYHQTRPILTRFNLAITPSEKVAFVGPSGAGKSTIIKLLLRMHDVTDGAIYIDRQNIARVSQESLWAAVSLVPQEPILFHRSLLENIRYGRPEATSEEVLAASKLAHCHEFIESFPDKYETFVGERGVKLSGGERQRVAIARAILRGSPILVLDEATSSLDSESEHLIQDALHTLMQGKTVIVIAHRLSTIMEMDRIIVLQDGTVVEQGTHRQLLDGKGLYNTLWQRQAGGFLE